MKYLRLEMALRQLAGEKGLSGECFKQFAGQAERILKNRSLSPEDQADELATTIMRWIDDCKAGRPGGSSSSAEDDQQA